MALAARDAHVRSGQGEPGFGAVIECCARKRGGGVAGGAILGETGRGVVRVGRVLVVGQVARHALSEKSGVLA